MASIQPVLLAIAPWDATKGASFYFTFTGSSQALVNHLQVTDVATGAIVYSFEYSSFEKIHPLPPNHFTNGKVYKAKIRVKFGDGTYSEYSNDVQFRTFASPVLDIDNIDGLGHVYNNDVTFVATYQQSDDEMVKTYRFFLYDENEDLLEQYPLRGVDPNSPDEFTEIVKGLEKNKAYFIECQIVTVNGMTYTSRERFIAVYLVPSANGIIQTQNDSEEGFIRINTNLKQILGTQVKGTPKAVEDTYDSDNYVYLDEDWIVIPEDKPVLFTGLGMNRASDFVMKVWCKDVPFGKKFLDISPAENNGIAIELWRYTDRVVAVKNYNGITSRYCSNISTIAQGSEFMLYVKAVEHRLDVNIRLV